MTFVRFPTLSHHTMTTVYDCKIKENEIKIFDDYVVKNNITNMDLPTFKSIAVGTLPTWRTEQVVGMDDIAYENYKKYITYEKA